MLYVGTDIIEIKRIKQLAERYPQFWERILTSAEKEYCLSRGNPWESLAGRFAAKEAILKCLGLGLFRLSWHDLIIESDSLGCPRVKFSQALQKILTAKGITEIKISISHCHDYALAVAIGKGD